MISKSVLDLYNRFTEKGITVWIDGGWCVDALLGVQTREHDDLDIAVHHKDNDTLRNLLENIGYHEEKRGDSSEYMYFMKNEAGNGVDIHVFEYDEKGNNIYGVEYPFGSLTGTGVIDGKTVNCVDPSFILRFKTGYEPKEKDIHDISALCEKFGFALPNKIPRSKQQDSIIIETERLILRPLTPADAETAYYGWVGDPEIAKYVSWLPLQSVNETIEWIKEVEWQRDSDGNIIPSDYYIWGFTLKETGGLFGSGGLIWENGRQLYQVGYNIMKTHWNHGYTTEAMKSILRFAAVNLGVKKVAGGHAKENIASARVIEKLGFVYDRDDITPHADGVRFFDSREYLLDLSVFPSDSIRTLNSCKDTLR